MNGDWSLEGLEQPLGCQAFDALAIVVPFLYNLLCVAAKCGPRYSLHNIIAFLTVAPPETSNRFLSVT